MTVGLMRDLFGVSKPVIAMLHLPALPGRPGHDRRAGMRPLIEPVARDLAVLQEAGVDGLLFCNEGDVPYQLGVQPEAVSAMAAVIGAVRAEISRPFGVNLVWDPVASLAVARAAGASFVREVFTGVYESDLGVMRPDFGSIGAYRCGIGSPPLPPAGGAGGQGGSSPLGTDPVALFANITPEFASSAGGRSIAERARSAAYLGVDALLISGAITGEVTSLSQLQEAKEAVPGTPVLANTGVTAATVPDVLAVADGVIVGTGLKAGGITWNPVDPARAAAFMTAARQAREGAVSA